ncbi:hypothetical protein N7490_009530 [Penicillium lividum]|nr:hypothetical protein N7490_009530 [Penicillium lividum]
MTLTSNVISDSRASQSLTNVILIRQSAKSIKIAAASHPYHGTAAELGVVQGFIAELSFLVSAAIRRHANIL